MGRMCHISAEFTQGCGPFKEKSPQNRGARPIRHSTRATIAYFGSSTRPPPVTVQTTSAACGRIGKLKADSCYVASHFAEWQIPPATDYPLLATFLCLPLCSLCVSAANGAVCAIKTAPLPPNLGGKIKKSLYRPSKRLRLSGARQPTVLRAQNR